MLAKASKKEAIFGWTLSTLLTCQQQIQTIFSKRCNFFESHSYYYYMSFKYRTLVNQHQHKVFSLALYLLRDPGDAEDITQEVYLKLWRNIEDIEIDRAQSWLLKLTRNNSIDRIRRKRLENGSMGTADFSHSTAEAEDLEPIDHSQEPSKIAANDQLSKWLKDAISKLEEPYRTLIYSRDVYQKSYKDIARELSLNLSQVKVYLHRARQQLRDILRELEL